jgi:adenine-specific DNA-methyltransferase
MTETVEKLPLTSPDLLAARLVALRDLFPEIFREGKVDPDALRQSLGESVATGPERYGLSWAGKADALRNIQTPSIGTLTPDRAASVDFDATDNLFIEGDNLEVLKLLQKGYYGKVKLIYIDPPYNTGNEFIYPDNFKEGLDTYLRYSGQVTGEGLKVSTNTETSGRYHSRWLDMMYPRLFLARNLLREDGVIFVSIDDHEAHNLRMLMNEVFGEENFIAQLVWEKGRKNDAKLFSVGHEYMICFARSLMTLKDRGTTWREPKPGAKDVWEQYLRLRESYGEKHKQIENALQEWYRQLPATNPAKGLSRYRHIDKYGPWRDRDISWPGGDGPRYNVIHPVTGKSCKVPERGWVFPTAEGMKDQIRLGLVEFRDDHTEPPIRKAHLHPVPEELDNEHQSIDDEDSEGNDAAAVGLQVMASYFYKQSQVTVKYLRSLMDAKVFDNPKDHEVLARIIRYVTSPTDIVLDFFAGSASTAEAVLRVNSSDNGKRRFIMVQLPEPTPKDSVANKVGYKTIANISKERIRRVIKKIEAESADKLPLNGAQAAPGFRAFKLAESNFRVWNSAAATGGAEQLAQQLALHIDHVQPHATPESILYEILLKSGFPLTAPVAEVAVADARAFAVADGLLLVCLAEVVTVATIGALIARKPEQVVCLDAAFGGNDQLKTNTVLQMRDAGITFHTV